MVKHLSEDGLERIDGEAVRLYAGAFKGIWLEEAEDAAPRASGDIGVAVVY